MKKNIDVVGAILIKGNKILCAQRGGEKSLPYLWEFPGGKIEKGETPQEALQRELKEELKIVVTVENDIYDKVSYEYDFGIVNLTTIICHLSEGEPVLTEHVDIKWLEPKEIKSLEWAPADIPTVEKLSKIKLS
ncbi:(deoxy)nucleoside triphosphate pyrophosphohydrolase [Ruoffia sp. FAM 26254]|uniref:(deoxy)nucleoside triphosphate pyrophosphohydrolase n=1 Tax=Ruoffia sp. FAM 26254 TaxID=3259518 RepID=UPI003883736F